MRRLFLMVAILFAMSIAMFAQNDTLQSSILIGGLTIDEVFALTKQDVTQFMGIPVDGTKKEMMKKLKKKGFRKYYADLLVGEFNGENVYVRVFTNKNKVYGIVVADIVSQNEGGIKKSYNNLCYQFFNSEKYKSVLKMEDYTIPDDEDISYNIREHNKSYKATFYQHADVDLILSKGKFDNLSERDLSLITNIAEMKAIFKKEVSFAIVASNTGYKIMIGYINVENQADGEDL